MKKRLSPYFVLSIMLAAIIVTLIFTTKIDYGCDTVKTILTSVKVKPPEGRKYVGFDLNKQNLTFGTLSPGAMAERTASSEYSKNATAYVWVEGDLSSWIIISPKKFETTPAVPQEIVFTALVPSTAREGEYNGKVVFCYQDR
ncbi:MAG: hypothetical protein Q7S55_01245 [Nanoarchaeota archaeon]|nr:hypothetical protein [Nanoarchaeota archaeon]